MRRRKNEMVDKYKNKYRIPSARLQNWDYGTNASYFVTICTNNRECFFGNIIDGNLNLSEIGKIANQIWQAIPDHFPYVLLDEFIFMPNHVHGIITIDKNIIRRDAINRVSTTTENNGTTENNAITENGNTTKIGGVTGKNNPMLSENLSRIIRWYKGRTTFECHKICNNFKWQSRFYDHIIRNDESFYNITKYIKNNHLNWEEDNLYKV